MTDHYVYVIVCYNPDKEQITSVQVIEKIEHAQHVFERMKVVYGAANVCLASRRLNCNDSGENIIPDTMTLRELVDQHTAALEKCYQDQQEYLLSLGWHKAGLGRGKFVWTHPDHPSGKIDGIPVDYGRSFEGAIGYVLRLEEGANR